MQKTLSAKQKGDIGELHARIDLVEKGYTILLPDTNYADFDFVAYRDGNFKRVQCKYRSVNKDGRIRVKSEKMERIEVDWYSIYVPDIDCLFYIDIKSVPTKDVAFYPLRAYEYCYLVNHTGSLWSV